MFRKMRRYKQSLSMAEIDDILARGTSGVLALSGDDNYPYALPISYLYCDNKFYFHSAKSGHKIDAIANNPKASFCVIDQDKIVPERYTTYFRSVIAFGRLSLVEAAEEKRAAIEKLAAKYAPLNTADELNAAVDKDWDRLCLLEMRVEHITGKEAIELSKAKE